MRLEHLPNGLRIFADANAWTRSEASIGRHRHADDALLRHIIGTGRHGAYLFKHYTYLVTPGVNAA